MASPGSQPTLDVLALCTDPRSVAQLRDELALHAMRMDCVTTIEAVRAMFFARGGHDLFVLAPDVPRPLAERTCRALRGLDPAIPCVAFGRDLAQAALPEATTRVPALHPNSRAGAGAVLRATLTLR